MSIVQRRNDELVQLLAPDFVKRTDLKTKKSIIMISNVTTALGAGFTTLGVMTWDDSELSGAVGATCRYHVTAAGTVAIEVFDVDNATILGSDSTISNGVNTFTFTLPASGDTLLSVRAKFTAGTPSVAGVIIDFTI